MLRSIAVKSLVEPYLPLTRLKHRLKFSKPKVRLVGVAKNEGRYLAEWILHHLYFGIDHIEVHYNQCDDNTVAVGKYLSAKYPVSFINADNQFAPHLKSPQVGVYLSAISKAYKDGYSHVLFLDVDEFLVPKDLSKGVHELINNKRYFDVISNNWCNKLEDTSLFGRALEQNMTLEVSPTVKSMVKTFITPPVMNPHNVVSNKLRYTMSGKAQFVSDREDMSKVTEYQSRFKDADFFVLHRQYRSQVEYVAMLGRGRPIEAAKQKSIFKNNRRGYNINTGKTALKFDQAAFEKYAGYLNEHMNSSELQALHKEAEQMVESRYQQVVKMIANAPLSERPLLSRLLKNINLSEVSSAFKQMRSDKVAKASTDA